VEAAIVKKAYGLEQAKNHAGGANNGRALQTMIIEQKSDFEGKCQEKGGGVGGLNRRRVS